MAKITKLGQGLLDLHSRRGEVDLEWLSARALESGANAELAARIAGANSAMEAFDRAKSAGVDMATSVVGAAWRTAARVLEGSGSLLEVVMFDRAGQLLARSSFQDSH